MDLDFVAVFISPCIYENLNHILNSECFHNEVWCPAAIPMSAAMICSYKIFAISEKLFFFSGPHLSLLTCHIV